MSFKSPLNLYLGIINFSTVAVEIYFLLKYGFTISKTLFSSFVADIGGGEANVLIVSVPALSLNNFWDAIFISWNLPALATNFPVCNIFYYWVC